MTIIRTALVIISAVICTVPSFASTSTAPATDGPVLGAVVFTGATAYSNPQLFPAYRDYLGKGITPDHARSIAGSVADLYVRDGYVRPEMALDDRLTARGVLQVNVHEARISRVVFEGDRGSHDATFERIAGRLTSAVPLRGEDIQTALREMRALPGVAVSATTRRDPAVRNAHQLVVRSTYSAIDGLVRVNNRGTDEVGPAFVLGQLYVNGLIGPNGKAGIIFAAASNPEEYFGGGLALDTAVGHRGTRANLLLFHSRSAPHEAPADLGYRYLRDRATLRVSHPLRAASTSAVTLSGGFEAENLGIRHDGSRIRDDRLRILETSLRTSARSGGGLQYSANLQLRHGLEGLGGGLDAADLADDPRRADFLSSQLQATVLRRFAVHWTARVDLLGQYSGHVLPDSERFKIGGDRLGRGFEVAEIAGDRGVGGKVELRRDLFESGGMTGRISTYGFYDVGTAWKQDRPGHETAATSGIGFSLSGAALTGYVEVATPVDGPDIEGRRAASVFAEMSWRF